VIITIEDVVKVVLNQELDQGQGLDRPGINRHHHRHHIKNQNNVQDQDLDQDRLQDVIKRKQNIKKNGYLKLFFFKYLDCKLT
jgi:hypothetical protein